MNYVNSCTFGGRLGGDAELRYSADGRPSISFRLAVSNRRKVEGEWQDDPLWMRVTCFGRLAERFQERPLLKGQRVVVIGRLDTPRMYERQQGGVGFAVEMVANDVARFDFTEDSGAYVDDSGYAPASTAALAPQRQQQPQQRQQQPSADVQDLDDLPF